MVMNPELESNQPLSNSLFVKVQKDILSGKIPANSKLTEQAICKKYNVSRTPVREAFRQLESDGLIENIPNRGAYVIGLSSRDISDLFDLRRTFEVQAVEWAIERMNDDEVNTLRENIEFMEFYTLKNDVDIIYKGTKNRMLYLALSTYQTYLKHSAPAKTFSDDYLKTILQEHKNIFEAFETKNVAAGKTAMDYHMKQSKFRRMSHLF